MKKETLEERQPYWDLVDKKAEQNNTIDLDAYAKGVVDGAKWQQERSYSEEEVEILLETLSKVLVYQGNDYRLPHYFEFEIKEVIKQFKKK